jgi:hypothetical protein
MPGMQIKSLSEFSPGQPAMKTLSKVTGTKLLM